MLEVQFENLADMFIILLFTPLYKDFNKKAKLIPNLGYYLIKRLGRYPAHV